jgi:hypothetical protein
LPFLLRFRKAVLLSGAALCGQAVYCISSLEQTDHAFQAESFFPDHNIQMYVMQRTRYEEPPVQKVKLMWGVKGVRRYGKQHASIPVWSEHFRPQSAAAQLEVLRVCNDGRNIEFVHNGAHRCFMQHFADWRIALDGPAGFPSENFEPDLDLFCLFAYHRGHGSGLCDHLASAMNVTGSWNASYADLSASCNAFWATAPIYMSNPNDGWSLPDWSKHIRWSCQVQDIDGFMSCMAPSDSDENYVPSIAGFYIEFDVQFPLYGSAAAARPSFDAFEALATETNLYGLPDSAAMQDNENWLLMRVEELLVSAGFNGATIALSVGFVTLLLSLRNWLVALLAIIHVAMVATCNAGALYWLGWRLGFVEALCLITVIGFSVDFVAHIGIAYSGSQATTKYDRTLQALRELGPSIVSGAVSTSIVAAFMTQCELVAFYKVGIFMLVSMGMSLFFALLLFPTLLATMGPSASFGELPSVHQLAKGSVVPRLFHSKRTRSV